MIFIDRRGLIKGAIAGAALVGMPASLQAMTSRTRLFVFDGRFAQASAAAMEWQAKGIETLDREKIDLGHAWRDVIMERIGPGGGIAGLTLWVDSFICETFGRDHGMSMQRESASPGKELRAWVMR